MAPTITRAVPSFRLERNKVEGFRPLSGWRLACAIAVPSISFRILRQAISSRPASQCASPPISDSCSGVSRLPDAIRAARQNGFDAVECHQPYREDPGAVNQALAETGLKMLALNTPPGADVASEAGLAALVGRSSEAREAIDRAMDYARSIGCEKVHVTAGRAEGARAFATFVENAGYAAERASRTWDHRPDRAAQPA